MKRIEKECIDEIGEVIDLIKRDDIARAKLAFHHMDNYIEEYSNELPDTIIDLLYDIDHYLSHLSDEKLDHIIKRYKALTD